jgi:hypothetical protein
MPMADDLTKRGRQDRERISLTEEWEVREWADRLGITEARLREVVGEVGHMADDVRRFLDENQ